MPQRFDRSELRKPIATREGFLHADAFITRVGIFTYHLKDGTARRELRSPEEVFHKDALASFANMPLTKGHPKVAVTSKNWKKYAVGTVGSNVRADGEFVHAEISIHDAESVADLEAKRNDQLSCGYTCELVETPGVWNGQAYDAIQTQIRGNHVAHLGTGRAGPEVRIRLDSADDGVEDGLHIDSAEDDGGDATPPGGIMLEKIKVDGLEVEVTPLAKQMLEREHGRRDVADANAKASIEKLTARADAADAKVAELEKQLAESEKARADGADPKVVATLVKARTALETKAAGVLGDKVKLDEMDERAIKEAVCAKLVPGFKADAEMSADRLDGTYEAALAVAKAKSPTALERARAGVVTPAHKADAADSEDPINAAQARSLQRKQTAWQPKAQS